LGFGLARVTPCSRIVGAHSVDFGQRDMRVRVCGIQAHRFEQQRQRIFLPLLHTIKQRQVVPGLCIPRLTGDPFLLLADVFGSFAVERRLDDVFAPEAHGCAPTRINRMSITLVLVGPVITRSPSD